MVGWGGEEGHRRVRVCVWGRGAQRWGGGGKRGTEGGAARNSAAGGPAKVKGGWAEGQHSVLLPGPI